MHSSYVAGGPPPGRLPRLAVGSARKIDGDFPLSHQSHGTSPPPATPRRRLGAQDRWRLSAQSSITRDFNQQLRRVDSLLECRDPSVELLLVDGLQDLADTRARLEPELEDVAPEQDRRGRAMLDAERPRALEEPVHRRAIELSRLAALAIGLRDACQQLAIRLLPQSAVRVVTALITEPVRRSSSQR